jgi:hypothetical protein
MVLLRRLIQRFTRYEAKRGRTASGLMRRMGRM